MQVDTVDMNIFVCIATAIMFSGYSIVTKRIFTEVYRVNDLINQWSLHHEAAWLCLRHVIIL